MSGGAEGPLSKIYRIKQLAKVGAASCDTCNTVEGLPLALEAVFETIVILAGKAFDDMEAKQKRPAAAEPSPVPPAPRHHQPAHVP